MLMRVGDDHLPRDQVLADAEMFQQALRLRAPMLVSRHLDYAKAFGFPSKFYHETALILPKVSRVMSAAKTKMLASRFTTIVE